MTDRPTLDATVRLGALALPNPIVAASGTFGYGDEVARLCPPDRLGAVTVKSLAAFDWPGNPAPRLAPLRCASWDSDEQVIVIFGGEGSNEGTLVYDPFDNSFTRMNPKVQPAPRASGNMAYDAMLEGKSGLMSALVEGRYDLVPIPDPKLGPRKLDVATTYNTERCRPNYANKRGLPIFLNRAS